MFAVPSPQPAANVSVDSAAHDHLASATLLTNLCHVTEVSSIAWRVYHLPSADLLIHSLDLPAAPPTPVSAFHTPLFRAQHALRHVWSSPTACSDGLLYTLQQDGVASSSSSSSALLLFVCHIRSPSSGPARLLPGEERLSQYGVDSDELSMPVLHSARLFSSSFSCSVFSLLSEALCNAVLEHRPTAATTSPTVRFVLLGSSICAAILPISSHPRPPAKRHINSLAPPSTAPQPSPSSSTVRGSAAASMLPRVVSPSAYLSPPDSSQSLPSPYPSEAVDMVDDPATAAPTLSFHPLHPPSAPYTKAAAHATDTLMCSLPSTAGIESAALPPLPSYLASFVHGNQKAAAYRSPHTHPPPASHSTEQPVQLKPDVLADMALSINTFPSLSALSTSTRRSLAIVSADDSDTANAAFALSTPSYTLHSAYSDQLLGPPPLSASASYVLSPSTPGSMPGLSPLVADDDGKLSPGGVEHTAPTALIDTVQQLPFLPWTIDAVTLASDAMDTESEWKGLTPHFIRFLKQQSLAPLSPAFQRLTLSSEAALVQRNPSHWQSVQLWLSGCSLLKRHFVHSRPFPLLAKQLSLPAFELGKHSSFPHASPASSLPPSASVAPLPLVSLPPARLVFGIESELRDVPASAASLYTQSNLRPALTAKDAVYAVVLPASETVAADKRVDVWFDAFSAAYENGGLGRHRPLSGHGRSGVLKLRSIYEVLRERDEASMSTPATPASPADSGTVSNAASPRSGSSNMIVLSSDEPTGSRAALPLSHALALHSTAAPDGMRRYYQSIVAAVIAELDGISKGQGAEQLDRFDALILYILVDDKLGLLHDASHMSDYLSCLYFDRHSGSSYAAALSQLEQMDVVVRLLPSSALTSLSSASFTSLSLSVHSSIRRLVDRVDSESEVELPKHVYQLYEPVTYIADKRAEGKENTSDTAGAAASDLITLVCVWSVVAGRLVACTCDERGQVMDSFVGESAGTVSLSVRQCWGQCVLAVATMAQRHRTLTHLNVQLVHWMERPASTSIQYEEVWRRVLAEQGFFLTATTSPATAAVDSSTASSAVRWHVNLCSLHWDPAFSVLALHTHNAAAATTNQSPAFSASSASTSSPSRLPWAVEGINSPSTLASHYLSLPPQSLFAPNRYSVPLASGLLFLHRAADAASSYLARPVPAPLPGHTGTPLLLTLHQELALVGGERKVESAPRPASSLSSHAALLASVAHILQQLSLVHVPLPTVMDGGGPDCEGEMQSGALPLPVCIVRRLIRLLSSCLTSA